MALYQNDPVEVREQLQFSLESYKVFFRAMGFESVTYDVVKGRMPCAIAIIVNQKKPVY